MRPSSTGRGIFLLLLHLLILALAVLNGKCFVTALALVPELSSEEQGSNETAYNSDETGSGEEDEDEAEDEDEKLTSSIPSDLESQNNKGRVVRRGNWWIYEHPSMSYNARSPIYGNVELAPAETLPQTPTGTGTGTVPQTPTATGTGAGTVPQTPTGTGTGTLPQTPTGTGAGTGAGTVPQTPAGTSAGTGAGTVPQTPAGTSAGTGVGTVPQTLVGTSAGTGAGTLPQTPTGTSAGTVPEPVTPVPPAEPVTKKSHNPPPAIFTGTVTYVTPAPDPIEITTPLPIGDSNKCKGVSLQSPIPLGRPTRWKISELGSMATEELPQKKQRIQTNKYYGRLRDRFFMQNDGSNFVFFLNEMAPSSLLAIKVKEWDDEYMFAKGVMHWGGDDGRGSEHTVHGVRYPMEIQFIHYKRSAGSLVNATKQKLGVMIASVLYEFSGYDKEYLEPLMSQSSIFRSPGRVKQVHGPLDIMQLYPGTLEHYEYEGSWTVTPCSSATVRRIVFATPAGVGRDQLQRLRYDLTYATGQKMVDNYRKLQDPAGRKIKFNPTLGRFDIKNLESLMDPHSHSHALGSI